jgi:hypothetical protein
MDALVGGAAPVRPLSRQWIAIFAGSTFGLLLAIQVTPIIQLFLFPLEFHSELLLVRGGALTVVPFLFAFPLAGGLVAGLSRRNISRELWLGAALVALGQWGFWIARAAAAGDIKQLFVSPLVFSTGLYLPAFLGLVLPCLLGILLAPVGGRAGAWIAEQMTGARACDDCQKTYALDGKPLACPHCGSPITVKPAVDWRFAGPSVAATLLLFFLLVRMGGPALGFYWRCDFKSPDGECRAGVAAYNASQSNEMYYWRAPKQLGGEKVPGIILHPWKYIGVTAPLFALAPFFIAARCRRSRKRTIGVSLLTAWLGATAIALFALGFGEFDSVVVISLRLHLLAGAPWCLAGAAGMALGKKLAPKQSLEEEFGLFEPASPP